jgi:hypothetical protein
MAKSFKQFATKDLKAFVGTTRKSGVRSINYGIARAKTQAIKEVAKATGGKQKDLRTRIGQFKASNSRPKGAMISFAKPVPLSAFSPKSKTVNSNMGKRKGTTVKGPEGRYLVTAASLATYASGKTSVFTRLPGGKIKNLYTNALIKYMSQSDVSKRLLNLASDGFSTELVRLAKLKGFTE